MDTKEQPSLNQLENLEDKLIIGKLNDGQKNTATVESFILGKLRDETKNATTVESFSIPDPSAFDKILEQRGEQRKQIFSFAKKLVTYSFYLIIGIIVIQSIMRIFFDETFAILQSHELEVLVISVFGQTIGVVHIITKYLWDDSPYLPTLHQREKKNKNT